MSKPTIDPRAGMTSASNAAADLLCPGRHLAQRGLRDAESETAISGTRVHEAFAKEADDDPLVLAMTSSQRKTRITGRAIERKLYEWWQSHVCGVDDEEKIPNVEAMLRAAKREVRMWAHLKKVPIHSGQLDAFWLSPDWKFALVEDLKSLYGDVEDADTNQQLRDCAALLWENFGCEMVSVYINQPNVKRKWDEVVVTTYAKSQLEQAHKEMIARVTTSNTIGAKRTPGLDQCKFCRAAGTVNCPESLKMLREDGAQDLTTGTPAQRGGWLDNIKAIEKMVEAQLARAKSLLQAHPDWIGGWKIGKGKKVRKLDQIISAGTILQEAYPGKFKIPDLLKCCKLSVPSLEELHDTLCGKSTQENATVFKNLVGHLIELKETEGSLERVKGTVTLPK